MPEGLAKLIEEVAWGNDLDAAKILEGLEMAFVPCDQIVHARRGGALQDAMVVRILYHTGEV